MELMTALLGVSLRWVHIMSVVVLLGGLIYARFVVYPALNRPDSSGALAAIADRFVPWIWLALAGLVVSGLINFMMKSSYPHGYHMWFGIKMLLVLHIVAVFFQLARVRNDAEKRARWMKGVIFSGLVVVAISGYLRCISIHV
jgi:uncharacterized membrane protein